MTVGVDITAEARRVRHVTQASVLANIARALFLLLTVWGATNAGGCATVRIITPYDEFVDRGLQEYREDVNAFVATMVAKAGTEDGTYEAHLSDYNLMGA